MNNSSDEKEKKLALKRGQLMNEAQDYVEKRMNDIPKNLTPKQASDYINDTKDGILAILDKINL